MQDLGHGRRIKMKIIKFLLMLTFVVYLRHGILTLLPEQHIVKGESIQMGKNTGLVTLTSRPDMKGKKMYIPLRNILIIIEE
jgi:hypothetical protein